MSKKHLLLAGSLLSGFLVGMPAFAQEPAAAPQDEATDVGELIVTGTRLRLPEYTVPVPVTSVGAAQIERSGDANIAEILSDVPALTASLQDQFGAEQNTPYYVGLNLLELRNLGLDRTLVLVNGRRHVAGFPGSAAVDVNSIPTDLIERVDVTTGASSAIYGADAVSGVVNFILKRDFEGLQTRSQVGWSEDGGGETVFSSVMWGKNFADRANLTVLGEYYRRDDVKFSDRDFTKAGVRKTIVTNPDEVDQATNEFIDDPNVFDNILSNNLRYIDTSPEGSIITQDDFAFRWLGNGQPFETGLLTGSFIMIGGSGSLLDLYNDDLIPGQERYSFNVNGTFDFTERHRGFAELKYVHSNADFTGQPSYDYGLFIPIDNPFIPQVVLDDFFAAQANGADIATAFGLPDGVLMARDNFDLGPTKWDITRQTGRVVVGLEGDVTEKVGYEISAVYGYSKQDQQGQNIRINERFFAATDVTTDQFGNVVCRSNLDPNAIPFGDLFAQFAFDPATWGTTFTPGPNSGCRPLNIFGVGNNTQDAIDWVHADIADISRIDQWVFNANIRGDTSDWFEIPTGGPVFFAVGAEHRIEKSRYFPSDLEQLADVAQYPISFIGSGSVTVGDFDVSEAFVEIGVPLLKDKPFAQDLTLIGAYRYSDYSTAGSSDTWNAGLSWKPTPDVMLRAGRAKAVRAPNISDLFLGRSQTFETLVDPCSQENLADGENPTLRAANCQAALGPLGFGPNNPYFDTSSEATAGFVFGNVNLVPETANTTTYGLVFTPRFVPGLSVSIDYYDIEIEDAIQTYEAQTIVDFCFDLPQPNQYCDLISRQGLNDPFPGRLSSFDQIPNNIAVYKTSGVDFTVRYRLVPERFGIERDIGVFDFAVAGNKLNELTFLETPEAAPRLDEGDFQAPEWQATFDVTWEHGPWSVNYGFNYFDETRRVERTTRVNEPDYIDPKYLDYPAREEHDIQVAYRFDEDKFEVYGGVNNFTDQKPVFQDFYYPVSPLGRFFYVGLKAKWK